MRLPKTWIPALVAAMALLTACGGGSETEPLRSEEASSGPSDQSARITVAQFGAPTVFDPHLSRSPLSDPGYLSPVYDQLLRLDDELNIQPMLASEWTMSADGRQLVLELVSGVTFHDGADFDAATVVANFERAKALPGSTAAPLLTKVASVIEEDADTVRIEFSEADFTFPYTLASSFAVSSMISPAAIEERRSLERQPAGSGPYELVDLGQDRATFRRVQAYWDAERTPQIAEVTIIGMADDNARLNGLQSGQLQVAPFRPNQSAAYQNLVTSGRYQKVDFPGQVLGLYLNTSTPGLDDPRVRKALSMAIDRRAIDAALFDGQVGTSFQFYPESMAGYVPDLDTDPYDPDAAEQLLAEAGHPDLTLDVILTSTEPADSIATIMQAQLAEVGVTLNLQKYAPTDARPAWRTGVADAFGSSITYGGDPSVMINDAIVGPDNPGSTSEKLAEAARTALDTALDDPNRAAAFENVTRVLAEEPLHILAVPVPMQFIAADNVQYLERMSISRLGPMVDVRALAVSS